MIRLYGHYASQPCWSVCWLLQIHHVDYEFIKIDPSAPHVAKPVEFLSKFPLGLIPAMIDNTGDDDGEEFCIAEASAIMIYLCTKYGWNDWYPTTHFYSDTNHDNAKCFLHRQARIHQYISHHNESSRMLTRKAFRPAWMTFLFPKLALEHGYSWDERQTRQIMQQQGHEFQTACLGVTPMMSQQTQDEQQKNPRGTINDHNPPRLFIGGYHDKPSIADLLAYPEFKQITLLLGIDYENLPYLQQWFQSMECIEYHNDMTRTTSKLGMILQEKKKQQQQKENLARPKSRL